MAKMNQSCNFLLLAALSVSFGACGGDAKKTDAKDGKVAEKAPAGSVILCVLPDTGERYLSTILFEGIGEESDPEPGGELGEARVQELEGRGAQDLATPALMP